jgi:hypothetical protein
VAYVQNVPMPFERLVETLNQIWVKALGLAATPAPAPAEAADR